MKTKTELHKNNKHKAGYNLDALCLVCPELNTFVYVNKYNKKTIDFANPKAVKLLNKALLISGYHIEYWEFPDDNLCPPIPGRVDYIHYLNDLLIGHNITKNILVLDVGTGATCIYPLLGYAEYNWQFVGTDIDKSSLESAEHIVASNNLSKKISFRYQKEVKHILDGVIKPSDRFSVSMCNPPFYKSEKEAIDATTRKQNNLKTTKEKLTRNFSGKHNELWYEGGEKAFLHNYIYESTGFKDNCIWFTSLVSKKELLKGLEISLKKIKATQVKIINMGQGHKLSRIIAWTFQ
ncbi:23S rRNA methyltransferase [Tamlana sedimentorum]|uniref:Ribosomal RNA large subunit methyltransferase F n=1 Tax=Neotamlana sedimentorum TaxID=1435349 RepID=A0A0D7WEJ0_9FLAO|nr:23S rRNA (adenine(1618)-N(6))-methyltransferase RlmF [Tamlana sedimentorum]KJD36157.1 23S rRNA methyltransferase [Tamlana sedimentorum]